MIQKYLDALGRLKVPCRQVHLIPVLFTALLGQFQTLEPVDSLIPHFLAPEKERSPGTLPAPALTHRMILGKSLPSLCLSFPIFLMQG